MFSLTRRQAHAALAGVAAAGAYLAAAEIGSKKTVRVSGLFVLSSMAMAGMVGQVLNGRASAKAHAVEARLTHFLGNGGSLGGALVVNGNHTITGQLFGSGGTVAVGDHINMQGNNLKSVNSLDGGGSAVSHPDGATLGANMAMNNNSINMFNGSITGCNSFVAAAIGPGGTRANLGGTATLNQLTTRCDYLLDQLQGANICY